MLNKKLLTAAVATAVLTGAGFAQAQEKEDAIVTGDSLVEGFTISGNVALTTDYKFRGISQSNRDGALQGGFDAEFGPGFYVGTWASVVNFDTNGEEGGCCNGSMELDYYAGWASSIGDTDFGIDVGYIYYSYPGDNDNDADYQEVYVSGSWRDFSLSVNYSDDYYLESDEFWYVAADYSFSLLEDLTVDLHVGYNMLEEDGGFLATDEDAYTDYSVGVTYSWAALDWSLAYVGTDLDEEDVFDTTWGEDRAIFTLSKSL